MNEVHTGQLKSLSVLYDRYHLRLYNFFFHQTRDVAVSEDLTQNVFERVIKYRARYHSDKPFMPWLFAIARNVHTDLYRKKVPYLPGDDKVMAIADVPHEQAANESIHSDRLRAAMNQLTDEQRQLLLMVKYENMKYSEAADSLGCSVSALKVRVHRTMKDLKREFFKINSDV